MVTYLFFVDIWSVYKLFFGLYLAIIFGIWINLTKRLLV